MTQIKYFNNPKVVQFRDREWRVSGDFTWVDVLVARCGHIVVTGDLCDVILRCWEPFPQAAISWAAAASLEKLESKALAGVQRKWDRDQMISEIRQMIANHSDVAGSSQCADLNRLCENMPDNEYDAWEEFTDIVGDYDCPKFGTVRCRSLEQAHESLQIVWQYLRENGTRPVSEER